MDIDFLSDDSALNAILGKRPSGSETLSAYATSPYIGRTFPALFTYAQAVLSLVEKEAY